MKLLYILGEQTDRIMRRGSVLEDTVIDGTLVTAGGSGANYNRVNTAGERSRVFDSQRAIE